MASYPPKPRNRNKNFNRSEIQLIAELVEKHISILNSKLCSTVTHERKKAIWAEITSKVNALGVCQRTTKEIKTKWTNMHQTAKREFSNRQLDMRKTGGGPCIVPLSTTSENIVDIYKECPSFTGLTGIESDDLVMQMGLWSRLGENQIVSPRERSNRMTSPDCSMRFCLSRKRKSFSKPCTLSS
ncbi:uncharacterized protein LOC125378614 [Haliotis rufescens]|uniref:uncharacterized protein LOC125378614 n=1 Tax=Haliotis rufescens TaxID=6454 RepID=UPI00201F40F7|nr:uncharacterized protein LOC125378614 [Haliotis rufescens]